jgi:hypothetical protein
MSGAEFSAGISIFGFARDHLVQTKRQRIRHEMKYGNGGVGAAGIG